MVFSALLKALLGGARPGGEVVTEPWTPPPALPVLPSLVALDALPQAERDLLWELRSGGESAPFVPGLYRMLAHWPGLLAHCARVLGPVLRDEAMQVAGETLRRRIDAAVPGLLRRLPRLPAGQPMPPAAEHEDVLAALEAYRRTSPEMVVAGRLLLDALPGPAAGPSK